MQTLTDCTHSHLFKTAKWSRRETGNLMFFLVYHVAHLSCEICCDVQVPLNGFKENEVYQSTILDIEGRKMPSIHIRP